MVTAPLSIKLRCASWQQLSTIYKRDLSRSAMFLKSGTPPAIGTPVRIDLTLPSESMIVLNGVVSEHIGAGGMQGSLPFVLMPLYDSIRNPSIFPLSVEPWELSQPCGPPRFTLLAS